MKEQRIQRIQELIKREISLILLSDVEDERLNRFTITKVEVTPDLRIGRIFIHFPGTPKEVTEKFEALEKASGFIKGALAHRIHIKFMPDIVFISDATLDKASHVIDLLNEISRKTKDTDKGK